MNSKLLLWGITLGVITPFFALAGGATEFKPLVGIPGLESPGDFNGYINALYALSISLAALIAVIKIVIAGAKYMMSDIVSSKSAAKEDIRNSLIGLLIIIGAVLILSTLNEDLTNFQITANNTELDNSFEQLLNARAEMCDAAVSRNSTCSTFSCSISDAFNDVTCAESCNIIGGKFDRGWIYDTCYYPVDLANQCDAQNSEVCCEQIKRGEWDNELNSCDGIEEGRDNRQAECLQANKIWNSQLDTCIARPEVVTEIQKPFPNIATLRNLVAPGVEPDAFQLEILNKECSSAFGNDWRFNQSNLDCILTQ